MHVKCQGNRPVLSCANEILHRGKNNEWRLNIAINELSGTIILSVIEWKLPREVVLKVYAYVRYSSINLYGAENQGDEFKRLIFNDELNCNARILRKKF